MKLRYLLILMLFLFSCESKNNSEIALFNNVFCNVQGNEKTIKITTDIKDEYFKYIENKKSQIPLYRFIIGADYALYIGIPFNAKLNNLSEKKLFESLVAEKSDSSTFYYKEYVVDSLYITEYAKEIDQNLIYILATTTSPDIQQRLFDVDSLSNRIVLQ
jgi:hypothetical protein